MPALGPSLAQLVDQRLRRRNTKSLLTYFGFVAAIVIVDSLGFQLLMWSAEGRSESFLTGIYWTLTTMSTLGLGDIVFVSTIGRLYTAFVLMTGVLLLLVVLPFAFIRFFYAPWLASRSIPANLSGHVIVAGHGELARPLIDQLELHGVPHFLVEPDPILAGQLEAEGIPVVARPLDEPRTYESLRISEAALVVLDGSDAENTASALQIRAAAPDVNIASVATAEHAADILNLAGVRRVLPLKRQLGQHLAARLNAGHAQTHVIGRCHTLQIAEIPVHMTPWVGLSVRELDLREKFGVNIVGIIEQAKFCPVTPSSVLSSQSVPVVIGTAEQIRSLDEFLVIYNVNYNPVIVIGGGVVGRSATRALRKRGVPVHVIDLGRHEADWGDGEPTKWIVGDAADRHVLTLAGIADAPGVLLTTNDDATNIYLALLCKHIADEVRLVSRVTHERNLSAVQNAGADVALSHTSIGVSSVFAALHQRELVVLGEGVELHEFALPERLVGKTLSDSAIAARTGLNVIAIKRSDGHVVDPGPDRIFENGDGLLMVGDRTKLQDFIDHFA